MVQVFVAKIKRPAQSAGRFSSSAPGRATLSPDHQWGHAGWRCGPGPMSGTRQWKEEVGCVTGMTWKKLQFLEKRQEKTLDMASRVQVVVRLNEVRAWRSL